MTIHALLDQPVSAPGVPVHMTLTVAQLDGLLALLNHVAPTIGEVLPDDTERVAAERGLRRLRGAVQGLRPSDGDLALERLGEALAGVVDRGTAELLLARVRDTLDVARLWGALEQVHREAVRGDQPHADRAARLLKTELLTTLHWRLDVVAVLRDLDRLPVLGP